MKLLFVSIALMLATVLIACAEKKIIMKDCKKADNGNYYICEEM